MTQEIVTKELNTPSLESIPSGTIPTIPSHKNILSAAKDSGFKLVGILVEYISRFVLGIVLARTLGAAEYGLFNLADSTFYLLVGLATAGLGPALVRYTSLFNSRRDEAGILGTIQIGMGIPVVFSLVVAIGLFIWAEPVALLIFDEPRLAPLLQVVAVGLPFGIFVPLVGAVLLGLKKIQYDIIAEDITFPVIKLFMIMALTLTGLTALKATSVHVVGVIVISMMLFYFLHRVFPLKRSWKNARREFKEIANFSTPIYGANLLNLFGDRLQTLLLGMLNTVISVGTFVAVLRVNMVGQMFYRAINASTMPIVSELYDQGDMKQLGHFYQTVTKWSLTFNLPLFLIMVLFARPILSIFGDDFTTGALGLVILSCGSLVDAATGINNTMLTMTGNTWLKTINTVISLSLRIILSLLLIPKLGMLGSTISIASATTVVNVVRTVEIFMLFRMWPYNPSFVKPIIAGLVATGATYLLAQWVFASNYLVVVGLNICLLLLIYIGITLLLGLSTEDRLVLNRIIRRFRMTWTNLRKK